MNKPVTYEELKQAQQEARALGWNLSNFFMLPAAIRRKCEDGLLSLVRAENALLLLEDAGSFYRMYYWLSPEKRLAPLKLDREVVVELPYSGELNQKGQLQVERLSEFGFVLGRESGMMSCAPDSLIEHELPDNEEIRTAKPQEIPEILALFTRAFDPRYAFLPTQEELLDAAAQDRLAVLVREDHVAAALHAGFEKTVATIHQLAVCERDRGCGLGKAILEAYHRRFRGEAAMYQHWVDLHNAPALSLYKGFGYGFSLRKANEYILSPK